MWWLVGRGQGSIGLNGLDQMLEHLYEKHGNVGVAKAMEAVASKGAMGDEENLFGGLEGDDLKRFLDITFDMVVVNKVDPTQAMEVSCQ